MSAPLSPERRATVRAVLADGEPATDDLLLAFARQLRDKREHDHPSAADWDWFCLNAAGWLADKAAPVLRRLLDAEARVAELEAERHSTNEALDDAVKAIAELKADRSNCHDDLAGALGYSNGTEWADLISIAAALTSQAARGKAGESR